MCFLIFTIEEEKPMDEVEHIENKESGNHEITEENRVETQMYYALIIFL